MKTPEKVLARVREYYHRNRAKKIQRNRDYRLKTKFGISLELYALMIAERNGLCDICKRISNGRGSLHVDHDHATGKIRGLLCSNCNLALGMFQDSRETILAAERYLRGEK